MKISDDIYSALLKATNERGMAAELSRKSGIAKDNISRYLSRDIKQLTLESWFKLYPHIRKYMPPEVREKYDRQTEKPSWSNELTPLNPKELKNVPVLSFANAACYDPGIEPLDDFAKDCADEYAETDFNVKPGYFALRVEGDSMTPVLPNGTIIYVAGGEYPERHDIVVAKIRESGEVVVKKYYRKDNVITLSSINPDGKNYQWNCKEKPGYLEWMWPVIEYKVQARRQRWEKHQNGNGGRK